MGQLSGIGLSVRCSSSLSRYSARSPAWRLFAIDVQLALVGAAGDEHRGGLVEVDVVGAQFGGPGEPRDQGDDDDPGDERQGDDDAVGLLDDVLDQRVGEDQGDDGEPDDGAGLAVPSGGHGDRERRGHHHGEDAGGVGAGLGVDVGAEQDRDDDRDGGVDQHDGADRARPVRGHAVAGQVARHDVDQPGHRRGAGEPQDEDRADVVGGAEALAEQLVREVGQGAAVGLPARLRTPRAGRGRW